jgi:hypothetical protein
MSEDHTSAAFEVVAIRSRSECFRDLRPGLHYHPFHARADAAHVVSTWRVSAMRKIILPLTLLSIMLVPVLHGRAGAG